MIRKAMFVALVLAGVSPVVQAAEPTRLTDHDLDRVSAGAPQLLFAFGGARETFAFGNASSLSLTSFGIAEQVTQIEGASFSNSVRATGFSRARVQSSGFGETGGRASAFAGSGLIR